MSFVHVGDCEGVGFPPVDAAGAGDSVVRFGSLLGGGGVVGPVVVREGWDGAGRRDVLVGRGVVDGGGGLVAVVEGSGDGSAVGGVPGGTPSCWKMPGSPCHQSRTLS
ncbi:hypothetical protein Aau02nite_01400 [Amorphoplanes auranticolor]|uniref:Uncharacterized protein n=1 Tax=Actinoplanes auranticolor TaxID=47988 RepID=A0A919VHZ5_9ACTN|nr:hypothetical protein Aau02nite_01400 [Actinoplanes auranticolor]